MHAGTKAILLFLTTVAPSVVLPLAAAAAALIPHRAVYDLSLRETRKPNAVERVEGRMVFEFTGSACAGYQSNARQVTELLDPEGETNLSDLRSSSWEASNGARYRFNSKTFSNKALSKEVDGQADRSSDGAVEVALTKPEKNTSTFTRALLFRTEHTRRIIAEAEQGRSTLSADVFDGASDSGKLYSTLAVIGPQIVSSPSEMIEAAARSGPLATSHRWPVRVSYFDGGENGNVGETTPLYTMGFELYENGVSRALMIDYGDFVLDGVLREIQFLADAPCPASPQ